MKRNLIAALVFVLALGVTLTISARPGGKAQRVSASPQTDRADKNRDKKSDDNSCRDGDLVSANQNAPLEILGVIPIPGAPPTLAFDINWADPVTERVYVADRTNRTLDIFDAEHNVFVGQVPGFVGTPVSSPACGTTFPAGSGPGCAGGGTTATNDKGPNGVVTVPGGYVMVGDGNSTLQVVSGLSIVQSISTNLPGCDNGTAHYCERLDEMGYDPKDHLVLALNDEPQDVNPPHAAIAPYGNWVDVSSFPFKVVGTFPFPGAGGAEQPVWDAAMERFIITVPGTATQQSAIAIVKPYASSIQKTYPLGDMTGTGSACQTANGLALGANQHAIASACGGVVIFNALTGKLISFDTTDVAPGDEIWANVGDGRGYVTGADKHVAIVAPATTQPSALGVFDMQSGQFLQNVDAQGVRNPTAFAEANTVFGEDGGAAPTVAAPYPNACAQFGYPGMGCLVIFKHAGLDPDDQ
jgi:hypothetical protein